MAIGFARAWRPGEHHRIPLVRIFGIGVGLALLTAGALAAAEGPLMSRVTEHLAAQQRRVEIPPAYVPIDYGWLAKLPTPDIRTAADLAAVAEVEQHAVAMTGYVVRVIPVPTHLAGRRATDWEFHLHLRLGPGRRCEYLDDPRNLVTAVTPAFQPPHTGWDLEVLYELCREQTRVRLSGWLLFDSSSRAQVGRSRASAWGIHPVTQIEVWNAQDGSWDRLR